MPMLKKLLLYTYGLAFVLVGVSHFTDPELFEPLVPTIIGWPLFWVYLSGVFEVVLGAGMWFKKTRSMSAVGLVNLLLVVYAANLNMWVNNIPFNDVQMSFEGIVFVCNSGTAYSSSDVAWWLDTVSKTFESLTVPLCPNEVTF